MALTPYSGPWTQSEAAHLLRRTLFGPTFQQINDTVGQGMAASVTQLLSVPSFTQPLAFLPEEMIVPFGFSWTFSNYPSDPEQAQFHENARLDSLTAWLHDRINHEGYTLFEKVCLFWHNHFGVKACVDSRATFDYFRLIQDNALGNFRTMIREMTTNPCMLLFLNGAENSALSPNENFARELLELYTIGKGPQIGPGDYTNYTELDVQEIAKIMTGWKVNGLLSDTEYVVTPVFQAGDHDTSDKTLSYHFANAVITNQNDTEYLALIDLVFQQPETARFICRKLYRWFVNADITPDIEDNIISEMAATLTGSDFELLPVLSELLGSAHFYDLSVRGAIIKNPLELIYSTFNATLSSNSPDLNSKYRLFLKAHGTAQLLNMNYVQPPNVAGWSAYYQSPNFSKLWVNASLIKLRIDFSAFVTLFDGYNEDGISFSVNLLGCLDALSLPSDATQVIEDLVALFCAKGLPASDKLTLKNVLTNGLPDFEWTVQYSDYLANPGNMTYSDPVKQRFALTLNALMELPEYQVI